MGDTVRIDKWLWAARFYKSRTQATAACEGGHVKVEGQSVKPSKGVRVGETVELTLGRRELKLEVLALAEKRGPASVARTLYHDLSPPPPEREPLQWAPGHEAGRPSKKGRRDLRRFKGRE